MKIRIKFNILCSYPINNSFQWYHPQKLRVGGCFGASPGESKRDFFYYVKVQLPPKHFEFHPNLLPSTLTHLTFGPNFNSPIDNLLPHSLTHLSFEYHEEGGRNFFNQRIDHLPLSLTHLRLGADFNQPIDHLPPSLTSLSLGEKFNHPINNLPSSLTHLSFSQFNKFNCSINALPALTHLAFGWGFEQQIPLPITLKKLALVNYSEKTSSLDSLTNLTSLRCRCFPPSLILPSSILELDISSELPSYPPNLQKLRHIVNPNEILPPFPPSLVVLETNAVNQRALPQNLQSFCGLSYCSFQLPMPSSLVKVRLIMEEVPSGVIQHVLTLPNLTQLSFNFCSWDANNILPLSLPPKLRDLSMEDISEGKSFVNFINLIQFTSAPHLESLSIQKGCFTVPYVECCHEYPPTLSHLDLENIIFQGQLPPNLRNLSITVRSKLKLPPLPNNISILHCSGCQPPSSFPSGLKELHFHQFDGSLPPLPAGLQQLSISKNKSTPPLFPSSLKKLTISNSLTPTTILPPRLKILCSGSTDLPELPMTLEVISDKK